METKLNGWSSNCSYKEKQERQKFGLEARNIRERLGLNMDEMAQRMLISKELLHRIEAGYVSPEPYLVIRLKKVQKIQYIKIPV